MVIKATVVARFNTASVSFARVVLKGQPEMKNSGAYKFLDIKDDGELLIGDKLEISITRVVEIDVAKVERTVYEAERTVAVPAALGAPYDAASSIPFETAIDELWNNRSL